MPTMSQELEPLEPEMEPGSLAVQQICDREWRQMGLRIAKTVIEKEDQSPDTRLIRMLVGVIESTQQQYDEYKATHTTPDGPQRHQEVITHNIFAILRMVRHGKQREEDNNLVKNR